jgi:hypothetical protein
MTISFWSRIAIVASIIWLGLVLIATSAAGDHFAFFDPHYRNGFRPDAAFKVTLIGLGIIWIARFGTTWILRAK